MNVKEGKGAVVAVPVSCLCWGKSSSKKSYSHPNTDGMKTYCEDEDEEEEEEEDNDDEAEEIEEDNI